MPIRSHAAALALLLAASPLLAQQAATPAAGTITGVGGRPGAGEIHVVGRTVGAQQIHFTSEFKVAPSATLRAVLSQDLTVGSGSVDIGAIASEGDQLIGVPKQVDVSAYTLLLVYDTKTKTVVASTMLPGGKGRAYSGQQDSSGAKSYR